MKSFLPQMEPVITDAEKRAVAHYLDSGGWLTEFDRTRELERRIAEYTGARFCAMTPSGTLALFLALAGSGIGRGDEVVVPAFTMAATATSALLTGAEVVFADIEPETFGFDFADAERRFTPRTKAVIFVSLNGRSPRGLAEFVDRCRARRIAVIEDAAQSLGSFFEGRHFGTIGDCGILSFSSQKLVTMGQGGAVLTDDEALFRRMGMLRDFGRLKGGSDDYVQVGWNLKFTDLQAVLGIAQMERLPGIVRRKRAIHASYSRHLAGIAGARLPRTDASGTTPWFVDILVDPDTRAALGAHLRENGIGSRPFYPALHTTQAFSREQSLPVAEHVAQSGLWLPSSLNLDEDNIARVCTVIRDFFARRQPRTAAA